MTTITDVVNDLINVGTISSKYVFNAGATLTGTVWTASEATATFKATDTETRFQIDTGVTNDVEVATFSSKSGFSGNTAYTVLAYDGSNVLLGLPNGSGGFNSFLIVSDSPILNTATLTDLASTGAYTPPPVICYAEGTRIRTAAGDVAVEDLAEGDLVMVHTRDGAIEQPVVWVGRRRIDVAAHPNAEDVLPIRVRRDAFARGLPKRDLLLSPEHALFIDSMLIPARLLINGGSIMQEAGWRSVVYYHVELPQHGIIFAEDLCAESYLDTGNRALFENGSELMMLHPDFSISARLQRREDGSCAPFVVAPAMVRPIWHRLAQRSGRLGYPVWQPDEVSEPNLRLRIGQREVRPVSADGGEYLFVLPPGTDRVQLISRAARPNETRPWVEDSRRLGVRIGRMVLNDDSGATEIALDDPALITGWWAVEIEGRTIARWTDGCADLALPPCGRGGRMLKLRLAGSTTYPASQPDVALPMRKAA